ncbi:hypothetical protein G4B11_009202 [Aspergillus flavus]|nr:hypothetical protein G4B11_009202 [Aspergillus flavus]
MLNVFVDSVGDVEILATEYTTAEQRNAANYIRKQRPQSPSSSSSASSSEEELIQPSTKTLDEGDISQLTADAEPPKGNQLNENPSVEGPARTRNNFIAGVVGEPLQLQNIGPVDRALILKQLISKTAEKYEERYALILDTEDIEAILEQYLNPTGAELRERIRTHNDIYRRKRNPSLHYHVWDSAGDMESIFVTLGTSEKPTSVKTQLLLNLLEMWMALVFQTLTSCT